MRREIRFAFSIAMLACAASCQTTASTTPLVPAKPVEMITLDQLNARLAADRKDGKVAVLHMWATWCGPCVEEFPMLSRFYREKLADDPKVDFFAVSVDEPGDKSAVESFLTRNKSSFTVFIADAADPTAFSEGVNPDWPAVLPTTFVYRVKDGKSQMTLGEVEDLEKFKTLIDESKKP